MTDEKNNESSESSSCGVVDLTPYIHADIGKQIKTKSLCVKCGKQGKTRMVFIDIPKFGNVIVSSFSCKYCGFSGRDVQQTSDIQDQGIELHLSVRTAADLSRGVVKSSYCTVNIPELGFEIEARPMSGIYTSVEGLIRQCAENLAYLQEERRKTQPDVAEKIDVTINNLNNLITQTLTLTEVVEEPIFTLIFKDPSGNSFIEPIADLKHIQTSHFNRTTAQAAELGLTEEQEQKIQKDMKNIKVDNNILDKLEIDKELQPTTFQSPCPLCGASMTNNSCIVNIPYFKDLLLLASFCDECGYKSVDAQAAGAISKKGCKIVFKATDPSDLSRDVLKSVSCRVRIYEIGLELEPGSLGGFYTTLEGMLRQIHDELSKHSKMWFGDSARSLEESQKWSTLLTKLDMMAVGKEVFTIELDDPLDQSFIQNIFAPDDDPELKIEYYERTQEQNEELGLIGIDSGSDDDE